jgi:hypothetical protein
MTSGGICGVLQNYCGSIKNCGSRGILIKAGEQAGGILGDVSDGFITTLPGLIENCEVSSTVMATKADSFTYAGGIAGRAVTHRDEANTYVYVNNCTYIGRKVESAGKTNGSCEKNSYVGRIVGYFKSTFNQLSENKANPNTQLSGADIDGSVYHNQATTNDWSFNEHGSNFEHPAGKDDYVWQNGRGWVEPIYDTRRKCT